MKEDNKSKGFFYGFIGGPLAVVGIFLYLIFSAILFLFDYFNFLEEKK